MVRLVLKCLIFGIMVFGGMCGVFLTGFEARASVVVELSQAQKVALSHVIVRGRVVQSEAVLQANGKIETKHVMEVTTWFKSDVPVSGDTLTFYTRGGALGDLVTRVGGEAQLVVGDEVVLFLERLGRSGSSELYPIGLSQGAFIVQLDSLQQKRVIRSDERVKRRHVRTQRLRASTDSSADLTRDPDLETFEQSVLDALVEPLTRDEALKSLPGRRTM